MSTPADRTAHGILLRTSDVETEPLFAQVKALTGVDFVPRLFRAGANAPQALAGMLELMKGVLGPGKLRPTTKQAMMVAIASTMKNRYCAALHSALCKSIGMDEETLRALASDVGPEQAKRDWAVVHFGVRLATNPKNIDAQDVAALRDVGFDDAAIVEAVGVASFAAYAVRMAEALGLEVDPEIRDALGPDAFVLTELR